MAARLGIAFYWAGWIVGGSLAGLAVSAGLFGGGNDSWLLFWLLGIPAVAIWLVCRAARFVLTGD